MSILAHLQFIFIALHFQTDFTGGAGSLTSTCFLYVKTDPFLWKFISEEENSRDGDAIRTKIRSIVNWQVKLANDVLSQTPLLETPLIGPGGKVYANVHFKLKVQVIDIESYEDCELKRDDDEVKTNRSIFCSELGNSSAQFFETFSKSVRSISHDFCLLYAFTHRKFIGGVGGTAFLGATNALSQRTNCGQSGQNVGITVYSQNVNRSTHSFLHEIGHSFGAKHEDKSDECEPPNSLMIEAGLSQLHKFSDCSAQEMGHLFNQQLNSQVQSAFCYKSLTSPFCGNQAVELGEECDCGYSGCSEKCCHPRRNSDLTYNPQRCKRTPGSKCSSSEGPCCDPTTCTIVSSEANLICRKDSDCAHAAYCNGTSVSCPESKAKQDSIVCNHGAQICSKGICAGSICDKFGYQECGEENPCSINCKKLHNDLCIPATEIGIEINYTQIICNDNTGYCHESICVVFAAKHSKVDVLSGIFDNPWMKTLSVTIWCLAIVVNVLIFLNGRRKPLDGPAYSSCPESPEGSQVTLLNFTKIEDA